jgi:hypothetical protein
MFKVMASLCLLTILTFGVLNMQDKNIIGLQLDILIAVCMVGNILLYTKEK